MDGGSTVFTLNMAIGMPVPRVPFRRPITHNHHESDTEEEGYIIADLDMADELLTRGIDNEAGKYVNKLWIVDGLS